MLTPNEALKYLQPAFQDLFKDETPNLSRFLRLAIDVLDPLTHYGPARCDCGKLVVFEQAVRDGRPFGYRCPECGLVYEWCLFKGPDSMPKRVALRSFGTNHVGEVRSESDTGVIIIDDETVTMPDKKEKT